MSLCLKNRKLTLAFGLTLVILFVVKVLALLDLDKGSEALKI